MKYVSEDLRNWFSKTHPKGDWVRIGLDGEIKGPCAREEGEGKPKCLNRSRAESMTKEERAKAARRKRRKDPVADRKGKGGKPVNVKTESYDPKELEKARKMLTGEQPEPKPGSPSVKTYLKMLKGLKAHNDIHKGPVLVKEEYLIEKNVPTNPKLWSQAKALAKKKFDVYPSAYANGWASKWYKKKGGGWKTLKEERQSTMKTTKDLFLEQLDIAQYGHIVEKDNGKDHEYEMARSQLKTSATAIKRLMEKLGKGEGNLQAWVQSKLTKASDYIDSVADYMDAKDPVVKEAVELSNQVKELFDEVVEDSEEETEVQYMVDKEGHKLDGEIIESYEVKSNGRVKVKTASGTGYIKEEDIVEMNLGESIRDAARNVVAAGMMGLAAAAASPVKAADKPAEPVKQKPLTPEKQKPLTSEELSNARPVHSRIFIDMIRSNRTPKELSETLFKKGRTVFTKHNGLPAIANQDSEDGNKIHLHHPITGEHTGTITRPSE
jgi:hypothetical protein